MESRCIMAFDPGLHTGLCIFWPAVNRMSTDELDSLESVWDQLSRHDPSVVVYESFHWQSRRSVDFTPIEVIGVIKLWCKLNGKKLEPQTPSQGKAFWTDDKLKRANLYVVGSPHKRDATRHMLHYLTFNQGDKSWLQLIRQAQPAS